MTSWLKCEFMLNHVGDTFNGVVSAVTPFGMFVELEDIYIEGLVHITSLPKDYYNHDPVAQTLTGERSGRQYSLGDRVQVSVLQVALDERKIDLGLAAPEAGVKKRKRRGSRKSDG